MLFLFFLLFPSANAQLDSYKKNYGEALQGEQGCASQGGVVPICLDFDDGQPVYTPDCPEGRSFFPLGSESQCRLYFTHLTNGWEEYYGNYTDATFEFEFKVASDAAPGRPRCDLVGSNKIDITIKNEDNKDDKDIEEQVPLSILGVFRPGNPLRDADACGATDEVLDICKCTAFNADAASAELLKLPEPAEPATGVAGTGAARAPWAAAGLASLVVTFASFA